jgi:hypothetical protein
MNPLIQHYQESVKEFEYRFGLDDPAHTFHDHDDFLMVKDFLLRDRIAFWESEIQRVEGMKDEEGNHDISGGYPVGWNNAIESIIEPYREAVEWGKKQLK